MRASYNVFQSYSSPTLPRSSSQIYPQYPQILSCCLSVLSVHTSGCETIQRDCGPPSRTPSSENTDFPLTVPLTVRDRSPSHSMPECWLARSGAGNHSCLSVLSYLEDSVFCCGRKLLHNVKICVSHTAFSGHVPSIPVYCPYEFPCLHFSVAYTDQALISLSR